MKMSEIEQILENIREDIFTNFHKACKFNFFHIMNPLENLLAVYIRFERKKDLRKFKNNTTGMQKKLMAYLNEKLEAAGKWRLSEVEFQIEMESKEDQRNEIGSGVPSEEEMARAKAAMREEYRGLSDVCDQILIRFRKDGVHEVYIFYDSDTDVFYPIIFYQWEKQIKEAEESGLSSRIKDAVYEELERVGRGNKDNIKVVFEFDSHENVEKNFDGNYYERLC